MSQEDCMRAIAECATLRGLLGLRAKCTAKAMGSPEGLCAALEISPEALLRLGCCAAAIVKDYTHAEKVHGPCPSPMTFLSSLPAAYAQIETMLAHAPLRSLLQELVDRNYYLPFFLGLIWRTWASVVPAAGPEERTFYTIRDLSDFVPLRWAQCMGDFFVPLHGAIAKLSAGVRKQFFERTAVVTAQYDALSILQQRVLIAPFPYADAAEHNVVDLAAGPNFANLVCGARRELVLNGVDSAGDVVAYLSEMARLFDRPNVAVYEADIGTVDFQPDSMSTVRLSGVPLYIPIFAQQGGVRRATKWIAPGGRFLIEAQKDATHIERMSNMYRASVEELLRQGWGFWFSTGDHNRCHVHVLRPPYPDGPWANDTLNRWRKCVSEDAPRWAALSPME